MLSNQRISQLACIAAAVVGVSATVALFVATQSGSWISSKTTPPGTTVLVRQVPESRVALAPSLLPEEPASTSSTPNVSPAPLVTEPWSMNVQPSAKPKTK